MKTAIKYFKETCENIDKEVFLDYTFGVLYCIITSTM